MDEVQTTAAGAEYTITGPKEQSKRGTDRVPVLFDGKAAWLYGESGNQSIRNDKGHWLSNMDGTVAITSETGKAMNASRWENARQEAVLGAVDAAELTGQLPLSSPVEAWRELTKVRALVALDQDARGGNAAYELVGRAAGWLASRNDAQQGETPAAMLTADGLASLIQAITAEQGKREAIDHDI